MPWPMSARRASLLVHGVDCLDAEPGRLRQVVILMKSVDDAAQLQADARGVYVAPGFSNLPSDAAPTTADGSVLVDVQLGGFVFTPAELNPQLGRTSGTFVQLVARADPRMAALPACALNIGIKHMAHFMLDAMSRMALRVQAGMPEYSTAMAANPQFYDFINQRMAEALQEVEEEVKASAERQRNMGRLNEEQSVEETMAKLELAMAEKEEEKKVVEDDEVVHDVVQQPAMVAAAAQ